jgi:hypothetical protein
VDEGFLVAPEETRLAFFPRYDHLEVGARPDVAPDLEQHDVIEFVIPFSASLPQIRQFA